MSAQPQNTRIDAQNPWPGLSAFDEDSQAFFNGRDAESLELLRLVGQAPLTMLFGKSGLGKTSLLQAGLFPRLRQQNMVPVYVRLDMRDCTAPLIEQAAAALQAEIIRHVVDAPAPNTDESLWEYLHGRDAQWWSSKNQLLTPLFVFDQFEEAFTLGEENGDAIERLRLDLADLIENRIPEALARRIEADDSTEQLDLRGQCYKLLLSFREDFLPEVEGWKGELPSLMRNRLRLLPMSADRAVQVVSGETPAGKTHELVDDATAREIVRFVAEVQSGEGKAGRGKRLRKAADLKWDQLEIEPALLSLLCEGLNEKRKSQGQTIIDAGLLKETGDAIIGDFYRNCVSDVPAKTRRFIENALITEGGFRNSYPLQDALDQGLLTEPLLRQLVDRRLLRIDHQLGADRVELIHDRLTEVVRDYRDRERERLRVKQQRRRNFLFGGIVAVFIGVAAMFAVLWYKAETERHKAAGARLLAQAQLVRSQYPWQYPFSALLAIESVKHYQYSDLTLNQFLRESLRMLPKPLFTLQHDTMVTRIVYSPNGKFVATATENSPGQLWDTATGQELKRLSHDDYVSAMTFSPDGSWLATASWDKTARLWDIASGQELKRLSHDGKVTTLAFSPDGSRLVTASDDKTARIWDTATGHELKRLSHDDVVNSVTFSPDGSQLATASGDKTRIWDAASGQELKRLSHDDYVTDVTFSPDGNRLATASGDKTRIWDAASGQELKRLSHDDHVTDVTFSPDGNRLATASFDNTARIWDAASGQGLKRLSHDALVTDVIFSPDGGRLVTASEDRTARLWDAENGQELKRLSHDDNVTDVTFSPDGSRIATASVDRTARIWDAENGQEFKRFSHDDSIGSVAFSPDGNWLATASRDKSARLWDAATGQELQRLHHDDQVVSVSFSPDCARLATASDDKTARIWDTATGHELKRLSHDDVVNSVTFSPDGNRLATASDDKTARIWDAASGQELKRLSHDDVVTAVTFSPDGNRLATASDDKTARIWDTATGQELKRLSNDDKVTDVTFSSDVDRLATASNDKTARIWGAASGQELQRLHHNGQVVSVTFSPDGARLATTSDDETARIWDTASGQELKRWSHDDVVTAVTFSPDGSLLATASLFNAASLWDAATGKELQRLNHAGSGFAVTFSPDGNRLATASKNKTARIWLWRPVDLIDQLCGRMQQNLSWNQWQFYFEGEPYQKTCLDLPASPGFREQGIRLINEGKTDEAVRMLKELNSADPSLQLNPGQEIRKWTALNRLAEAEHLLRQHKIADAAVAFNEIEQMDDDSIVTADQWNELCWKEALNNAASQVLSACDKAVASSKSDKLTSYRDSRGLVRALTGNTLGAIEDFEFYIEKTDDDKLKKQRQDWVTALRAGKNPFGKEVLESIRGK